MTYLIIKALHLIFIVTWFAGLFYIVRLFVYHVEARDNESLTAGEKQLLINQFSLMETRLWYGITWPSCILTVLMGLSLSYYFWPFHLHPWLIIKMGLAALLIGYHYYCGHILKKLQSNQKTLNSFQLRLLNEVATLFLVAMIFLAIFKDAMILIWAILGLVVFTTILVAAIIFYKKIRMKKINSDKGL